MRWYGGVCAALCLVVLFASAPHAEARRASYDSVVDALTLHAGGPSLMLALAVGPGRSAFETGEQKLLRENLEDPLALLTLPDLPTPLLGALTIDRLGPIYGPRITDLPTDVVFGALTLADRPIFVEDLRSGSVTASVRFATREQQQEDLDAMLR